jgi:uncharacterized cupin superfamily protein
MSGPILNLDQLQLETQRHGATFEARLGAIARRIGARKLGYRLIVVPPGKRAFPFHCHHANEEMFLVLEGSGTYRLGPERHPIRAGDVVCAIAGGVETAHQIVNTSGAELKYLAVSTMIEPDVFEYPDSGKFGAFAGSAPGGPKGERTFSHFGRSRDAVDYWEGE